MSMFLTIIIVSIATLLLFIQNHKGKDNTLFRIIAGICFAFSWVLIVMWFTVLIEGWQITLNTPIANSDLIPVWGRIVQNLLRSIVFLFPVTRLTLGILYALPILLIPAVLVVIKRPQATSIMLYSAGANFLFFWMLLIVDNGIHLSFIKIPIQGTVLLTTYLFLLYGLVRQRPFSLSSNEYCK